MKKIVLLILGIVFFFGALFLFNNLKPQKAQTGVVLMKTPEVATNFINNIQEKDNMVFTYPDGRENLKDYIEKINAKFERKGEVKSDRQITSYDSQYKTIFIYGSPDTHSFLNEIKSSLPIVIESDGIVVGDKKCVGQDVGVIMACPSPKNKDQLVVIYGGVSTGIVKDIHSVFHGPTDYVVFNGKTKDLGRGRYPSMDCFVLEGAFDKTDPQNWKVSEALQILPPKHIWNRVENCVVSAQ